MTSLNNSLVSMQGTLNTTAQGTGTETMNSLLTGLQSQQGALDAGGLAAGTECQQVWPLARQDCRNRFLH